MLFAPLLQLSKEKGYVKHSTQSPVHPGQLVSILVSVTHLWEGLYWI